MKSQGDHISFYTLEGTNADTFNITMFPQKGLYTLEVPFGDNLYLYDSYGKNYKNSIFIDRGNSLYSRVFYHPEDKASTYYAYLSQETNQLSGYKLDQDILITVDQQDNAVIVQDSSPIDFGNASNTFPLEKKFTIYNPYSENLELTMPDVVIEVKGYNNPEPWSKEEDKKFIFETFPDIVLPGENKEFTVVFQDPSNTSAMKDYQGECTIFAANVGEFVLQFTGFNC